MQPSRAQRDGGGKVFAYLNQTCAGVVDSLHARLAGTVNLEPHFTIKLRHLAQTLLHVFAVHKATISDENQFDMGGQRQFLSQLADERNNLLKFFGTGRFTIAGQRNIVNAARPFRHAALHEITVQQLMKKTTQLLLQQRQINPRSCAALKLRHLTIYAAPIAGIIGIEIDAY